jgi:hypothetical protein
LGVDRLGRDRTGALGPGWLFHLGWRRRSFLGGPLLILAAGGVGGGPPMPSLLLLGSQPGLLHGGYPVIGEVESIVGQELHFVLTQEENEALGDVAGDLHLRQVVAADQLPIGANIKVILVDIEHHPDPGSAVSRRTEASLELQAQLIPG